MGKKNKRAVDDDESFAALQEKDQSKKFVSYKQQM